MRSARAATRRSHGLDSMSPWTEGPCLPAWPPAPRSVQAAPAPWRPTKISPGTTPPAAAICHCACAGRTAPRRVPWWCIRTAWAEAARAATPSARPGATPAWRCCTCSIPAATPTRCAAAWRRCAQLPMPASSSRAWPTCASCSTSCCAALASPTRHGPACGPTPSARPATPSERRRCWPWPASRIPGAGPCWPSRAMPPSWH